MDEFEQGAIAALEGFREELLSARGRIENEDEPVFDVIVDLLDRVTTTMKTHVANEGETSC
jgi:hypothetical protein